MDYILTNLDDYNTANEEYNIKLDLWRKEIESRKLSIKVANEELETVSYTHLTLPTKRIV